MIARALLRRLFPRLVLLLAGVLAMYTLIGVTLLLAATRDIAASHTLRSLETKIASADMLLAQPDRVGAEQRLHTLGVQHRAQAPPQDDEIGVFQRDVARELARRLPARTLHLSRAPEPMLWIAAERAQDGWIGIPVLFLRGALRWSSALAVLAAVLLVFAAAAWYASTLVKPLRTLAAAAPGLVAGEPAPPLPRHAATEIAELAAALDRAAADTRAAAQERQLMLAGLSHDMRTPLARLVLALEMIDGGDAAMREGMAADLAELDAILGQFIAFVRDGRDEPGRSIDLGALLTEALAAQQRGGSTWQQLGDASATLYAKPLALRRALDNLLENAQRHGAAPFEVELRALPSGALISVRDRGAGVAPEKLHALGKPFYRADDARSGPGSGLGLATVARIAAWHGGSLELRNRDGGGFSAQLRLLATR